jgi:hypothetical protein
LTRQIKDLPYNVDMDMIKSEKFIIKNLAYYPPNNKIWGWMLASSSDMTEPGIRGKIYAYTFWAVAGKTISFNRHVWWNDNHMMRLLAAKIKNKYVDITQSDLIELWPDFHDNLDQRFVFYQLSNGFE